MFTIELTPGENVNIFRYLYCRLRLKFSQTARDKMEEVQASLEYAQELQIREDALHLLEGRNLVDCMPPNPIINDLNPEDEGPIMPYKTWTETTINPTEGCGIEVVEYDPDALDYLIQTESKELKDMLKNEGWA